MRNVKFLFLSACVLTFFAACVDLDITTPKGKKGANGPDGLSDFELWKQEVEAGRIAWNKEHVSLTDFFKFLKGNDGADGTDGKDGKDGKSAYELWKEQVQAGTVDNPHRPGEKWPTEETDIPDFWRYLTGATGEVGQVPHIGDDGFWYIGDEKTDVPATGEKGEPGDNAVPPVVSIVDGEWAIDGLPTGITANPTDGKDGKNGKTPTISIDPQTGNWVIDGVPTEQSAKGKDGKTPVVTIDPETGFWVIDGKPTDKTAFGTKGEKGENGKDGKSAYELWKEEVEKGTLKDPHSPDPDALWPPTANKPADFWEYLVGGETYKVVLISPYKSLPSEKINPYDGAAVFRVLDAKDKPVAATIEGLSPVNPDKSYSTAMNFTVRDWGISTSLKPADLPDNKQVKERTMTPKIKVRGKARVFTSTEPVVVPNKIHIRLVMLSEEIYETGDRLPVFLININPKSCWQREGHLRYRMRYERCVDGTWENYPKELTSPPHRHWLLSEKVTPTAEVLANPAKARKTKHYVLSPDRTTSTQQYTVHRTIRLLPEMLTAHESGNEEQKRILRDWALWDYRGDDTWTYLAISMGDNDGEKEYPNQGSFDYGEFYVFPELLYFPPEDPAPGLNTSKLYMDTKTDPDDPIFWGEFDPAIPEHDFYTVRSTGKDYMFVAHEEDGVKVWKPGKDPKKKEEIYGRGGITVSDSIKKDRFNNYATAVSGYNLYSKEMHHEYGYKKNFYIKGFKNNWLVSTNISYSKNIAANGEFAGMVRYRLSYNEDEKKWYLVNIWKDGEKWEIKEKKWPGIDYYEGKIDEDGTKRTYAPQP